MIKTMFSKGMLPVVETLSSFAMQRHAVIANNIANIDTPYFKARDLHVKEFQKSLTRAIDERSRGNPRLWGMRSTSHVHVEPMGTFDRTVRVDSEKLDELNILGHDENKRSIEAEMSEMSKNLSLHRFANALMVHEFAALESAIRERP